MSLLTTAVTPAIDDYLLYNFSADDDLLRGLRARAAGKGFPDIAVSPVQARFMQVLLKSIKAENVLEVGSLGGYSAIIMARALPENGKLITIEHDKTRADFARVQAEMAGLSSIIEVVNADAHDYLSDFDPVTKFDFFFADADKEGYKDYLDKAYILLRKGGIAAFDNALAFGQIADINPERDEEVKAIIEFNQYLINHKGFFSSLVTSGDGIAMAVKLD